MPYRHVVLFRIRDGVAADAIDAAILCLRQVATAASRGDVAISEDSRKGVVIVEDLTFESSAHFAAFKVSAPHLRAIETMSAISDWLIADWDSTTAASPGGNTWVGTVRGLSSGSDNPTSE